MPKISISYRRADSEAMTGRIFDRLITHYGKEAIFRDIDDIPPGIDFRVHINETLRKTTILLAVVGPEWLGMLNGGAERIQEESDPVRVEVETALRRRVPVIPVLIGSARMPSAEQLPPSLKDFAFRNAVKVDTGQDFDYHMDRLIRSVDAILNQAPKSPPSGETKIPTSGTRLSDTGSRQAVGAVADASHKKDTGSRAAIVTQGPANEENAKGRVSFSLAVPRLSPEMLWPPDRQGRMVRLAIAGAGVLALILLLFGIALRDSGGGGQRLLTLTGHSGPVIAVAFSPNGRLIVSGSLDRSLRVWDASTGLWLQTLPGDADAVDAVAFLPNGKRIISGGKDGIILVRDTDNGQRVIHPLRPDMTYGWDVPPAVLAVAVSPDGSYIASGSTDATVKIWNDISGTLMRNVPGHTDAVTAVAFSPDGRTIVSGSADSTVRTWEANTGQPLRILKGHSGQVLSVAVSHDGKLIAVGGTGNAVIIWSATTFQQLRTLSTGFNVVDALAFSPDSNLLAVGGNDTSTEMWDTDSGRQLRLLTGHSGSIRSLAFSPDGRRLASGSDDKTIGIWPAN